jgi:quercetin dioxygenase-like cupin family protein
VNDKPEQKSKPTHRQGAAHVISLADPERGDDTNEFQGYRHNAGVSLIVVDAPPGSGPKLHKHPYEEVFVVQEGTATFTAGEDRGEGWTGCGGAGRGGAQVREHRAGTAAAGGHPRQRQVRH